MTTEQSIISKMSTDTWCRQWNQVPNGKGLFSNAKSTSVDPMRIPFDTAVAKVDWCHFCHTPLHFAKEEAVHICPDGCHRIRRLRIKALYLLIRMMCSSLTQSLFKSQVGLAEPQIMTSAYKSMATFRADHLDLYISTHPSSSRVCAQLGGSIRSHLSGSSRLAY